MMARLIDANILYKELEAHKQEMTSEAVKGGLTLAQALLDATPTAPNTNRASYIEAERIAELVVEKLAEK